jgi:hypothetical protein
MPLFAGAAVKGGKKGRTIVSGPIELTRSSSGGKDVTDI